MTKVTRRKFISTAGAGGVGAAAASLASPAIAQTMPELKWRLAASWPKSLDTLYGGCEYFCKRMAEITDNRFQIQPFAATDFSSLRNQPPICAPVAEDLLDFDRAAVRCPSRPCRSGRRRALASQGRSRRGGNELLNDLLKNFTCIGVAAG